MRNRSLSMLTCCGALLGAVIGCSNQPTAPSSALSPSTVGTSSAAPGTFSPNAAASSSRFGTREPGVVFVASQGLYYDTFVVKDPLPMEGRFQLLTDGETEFGPGQPGYLGGRWWEDLDGDGIQDPEDHYFLCPLLPPGRSAP